MDVLNQFKKNIEESNQKVKIVYMEGWNENIILAANKVAEINNITPILLFNKASEVPSNLSSKIEKIIIDETDLSKYANKIYDLRKAKGIDLNQATTLAAQPNFLGATIVALGEADGAICGIEYSTADTLRAAFQIVKAAPGIKTICSAFIMTKNEEKYIFGDCSVNIEPNAEELASIANSLAIFSKKTLGFNETRVSMLSYSTLGSGKGPLIDKVKEAYNILIKDKNFTDNYKIFGESQFDASFDIGVMSKKAPNVGWKEGANVYVFPNLATGNIGYKIAQRMGQYNAIGPVILGLNKPINDLSRGASTEDVIGLSYITASQALTK